MSQFVKGQDEEKKGDESKETGGDSGGLPVVEDCDDDFTTVLRSASTNP